MKSLKLKQQQHYIFFKIAAILYSSKPIDVKIERMVRVDDDVANVDISWREPLQINGELVYFSIQTDTQGDTQGFPRVMLTEVCCIWIRKFV